MSDQQGYAELSNEGPTQPAGPASRKRRLGWAAALIAGGAVAGGIAAAALPAAAESTPSTPPSGAASAPADRPGGPGGPRGGGADGQRSDETVLTGADAEKATAAALKAVPGAKVDRVETDADGAVYEAHVTKSDGSKATVKFDKDFNVTGIEEGMGAGPGNRGNGPRPTPSATK